MPRIIRGQRRDRTFDLFLTAVTNPRPRELPWLLVDSEGLLTEGHTQWQHLKARDNWDRPTGRRERRPGVPHGADATVEQACPNAKRLLGRLRDL